MSTAIWLTQLRWVAVAGQLLVIGYVWFALFVPLPIIELLLLVTGTVISNVILWLWAQRLKRQTDTTTKVGLSEVSDGIGFADDTIGSRAIGVLIGIDVLTLTALLYFSGGAANPFIFFYFAPVDFLRFQTKVCEWKMIFLTKKKKRERKKTRLKSEKELCATILSKSEINFYSLEKKKKILFLRTFLFL